MQSTDKVNQFYDDNALTEWDRLNRHRTEYAVTLRALKDFLPPAPASILDIGGGPGRYAFELARMGYQVTLLDLSQKNLDLAEEKSKQDGIKLQAMIHGNALRLPLFEKPFDVVLLMGPLYHLILSEDRNKALREANRVLKPNGLIFAAFITRYAPFRDGSVKYPLAMWQESAEWKQLWENGINFGGSGFTDAWFSMPAEIRPLMEKEGFKTITTLGVEGIVAGHESQVNALQDEAWNYWVEMNYFFAKDPALHAAADHLLYIGKKG